MLPQRSIEVQADRFEEQLVVDRRRPLGVLLPQAREAAVAARFGRHVALMLFGQLHHLSAL